MYQNLKKLPTVQKMIETKSNEIIQEIKAELDTEVKDLQSVHQLNEEGWGKLNSRWAYFFIFLALLNEVVWRTQPEATWVNFKVWGMLPITIIFTAMQLPLINRYKL